MKFFTLTNLVKTQLPARLLLSILAVSLCLGTSDRASAIPDSPIPGSLTPSTAPINPGSTVPGTVLTPIAPNGPICANVNINIQNRTPDPVKITKLEFLNPDTNTFLDKNIAEQLLQSGTGNQVTRDLAGLGRNERTKLRVTYQHKQGANFAAPVSETTDRFVCVDGSTHRIVLNN